MNTTVVSNISNKVLSVALCIVLVLLALATVAIAWQETIIDRQKRVIRDLSGFHFSDGRT